MLENLRIIEDSIYGDYLGMKCVSNNLGEFFPTCPSFYFSVEDGNLFRQKQQERENILKTLSSDTTFYQWQRFKNDIAQRDWDEDELNIEDND